MTKKLIFCLILLAIAILWAAEPVSDVNNPQEDDQTDHKSIFPVRPFKQKQEIKRELDPLTEKALYPRLYITGYNPIINNRIEIYKINKGMNYYKTKPLEIPAFTPEYKEKIDFANSKVILSVQAGDFKIEPDVPISFDRYFTNMQTKAFHKSLLANFKTQEQVAQTVTSGL
ncbi:MAG TPA: hypothetical protein PKO26_07140, partial [Candidatus Cloacimonas sp.]|nr:hypothetical protein [Candidatus Cloacimonas sp.]